jgi:S-adenosylmethionine decarboxylase
VDGGTEWLVDAHGCDPGRLRDGGGLRALLDRIVLELDLCVVGEPLVHRFEPPGGLTALYLLTESHLCCHTYPESRVATFNLYCCRERPEWPWAEQLAAALGASRVEVRRHARGGGP